MNIFYSKNIVEDKVILEENDAKHLIKVLRKKEGDPIIIVDGNGLWIEGIIITPHPKKCEIRILKKSTKKTMDFHLHIAIAPIKSMDRFEMFLEKATEIGISEITLLKTDHGIRDKINLERCNKILIAAMKQSLKAELPILNDWTSVQEFVNKEFNGQKLIAHCEDYKKNLIKNEYIKGSDVTLMIGPEGDFSKREIENANANGFNGIDLGKTRLRNETAGIVCVQNFHFINYDG